jgi:hypothetical protein
MKKGSIQISISFLVIIILSLFFIIGGIGYIMQLTDKVDVTKSVNNDIQEKKEADLKEQNIVFKKNESILTQESVNKEILKEEIITNVKEENTNVKEDCLNDFSCKKYFVFVPLGEWKNDKEFRQKVKIRAEFFIDITSFNNKKIGIIIVPLKFSKKCNVKNIRQMSAGHHLNIKKCADNYADKLGIQYERSIGLDNKYEGGRTFLNQKVSYVTLGYHDQGIEYDRPALVSHELGHTYSLCDEYSFTDYNKQNRGFINGCENSFPDSCGTRNKKCLGNSPTLRDYSGSNKFNVCIGKKHYSVMGFSTGAECGFDDTGGYHAIN